MGQVNPTSSDRWIQNLDFRRLLEYSRRLEHIGVGYGRDVSLSIGTGLRREPALRFFFVF